MHIKRFEAPTLLEAVRAVKEALGPDALVLQTRRIRRDGGLFGLFGRSMVELTAAVDRDVRRGDEPGRTSASADTLSRTQRRVASLDEDGDATFLRAKGANEERAGGGRGARPDRSWDELRMVRALLEPMERELGQLRTIVETLARPAGATEALSVEVAALRRAMAAISAGESGARAGFGPPAESSARGRGERARATSREALLQQLDARLAPPRDDEGPRIRLLVGATGVGKTTTLAKLAARGECGARGVAVVSTDGFRVGAEGQLRTYADLLGVPFALATSAEDLLRQVERFGGRRIWIDTAGRGPGDEVGLGELLRCRNALGDRARVDLVLSATTRAEDQRREIARHRALRPDGLIVTKVDETSSPAGVVDLALDDGLPPLRWLGTGQRVPEDLRVPDPAQLADGCFGAAA